MKPVLLERFGLPGSLTVSTIEDAARLILQTPPARRGIAQVEALHTFRDALIFGASPGLARANFINAALEAGYYVLPETFLDRSAVGLNQTVPSPGSGENVALVAEAMASCVDLLKHHIAAPLQGITAPSGSSGKVRARIHHIFKTILLMGQPLDKPVWVWL